jgi:uncharacterized phage protein (TIGR02218 family)
MKKLTESTQFHLRGNLTTIATCWKIKLSNGDIVSFTDHDNEICVGGLKYIPKILVNSSAIESLSALLPNNLNIEMSLSDSKITNYESRYYEGAAVEVMIVNFMDSNSDVINVFSGYITSVISTSGLLKAKVQSYSDQLNNVIGDVYSPLCRANFCDSRCKLSIENFSFISHIDASINDVTFFSEEMKSKENGQFNYGYIEMISGANSDDKLYIKENHEGVVVLSEVPKRKLMQGDQYKAVVGCNKKFETCVDKFNNAMNFRGEPHIPGYDQLL